nr:iaa-alanine resistance protein 1 [Quercus suber]
MALGSAFLPYGSVGGGSRTLFLLAHELPQEHNFTDGMALGSAFLPYGSVGGGSRTLFLLAHELPQEV